MKSKIKYLICILLFIVCLTGCKVEEVKNPEAEVKTGVPSLKVNKNDTHIKVINGLVYYNKKLFSGVLTGNYADGKKRSYTEYFEGGKWGKELIWYYNGQLYTERYYTVGMKDSVNKGYWPNGNRKFEYFFSKGNYNGSFKEWYPDGKLSIWMNYKNGKEEGSQKGWRENGKLFINYVVKNGKTYGVVKSRLCYSVKDGKGQFNSSSNIDYNDSSGISKLQSE